MPRTRSASRPSRSTCWSWRARQWKFPLSRRERGRGEGRLTPRAVLERLLDILRPHRTREYRGLRGVGQRWERLARRRLEAQGYEILEANYRAHGGEIDFIAREGGLLCFVEVKGRSGPAFGTPAEAVTEQKQKRIVRAAEQYLARMKGRPDCRFDVVAIVEPKERGGDPEIEILRGAFDAGPER